MRDMEQPVVVGNPVVSPVMLIGQAPGNKEIEVRRPFAWTAGKTLFKWFARIGMEEQAFRDRVYMAAVCRCFPGKNPKGPLGLLNFGLATASKTLDAFSQMASQPRETVGWGVEVATKAGGVLNGFSQNYSVERMVDVFNEFFQAWLTQIIKSQE